jgi:hypothetical protein
VAPAVPAALVLTASDTIRAAGGTLTLSAAAIDSQGAPVTGVPIAWSVSDPGRGQITAQGLFTAGPDSGRVYVRAAVDSTGGVADSVAVRVMRPGTVRWTWAASEVGGYMPLLGGPALAPDGTVYVLVSNAGQPNYPGTLVALTPGGDVQWALPLLQVEGSTGPVVVPVSGNIWVVGSTAYLVSPSGTITWDTVGPEAPIYFSGAASADRLVAAQGLYVNVYDAATHAFRWRTQEAPLVSWLVPPTITAGGDVLAKLTDDTLFQFAGTDGGIVRFFLNPDTGVDRRVFGRGTVPVGNRYYLPMRSLFAALDPGGPLLWLAGDVENGVTEPVIGPDGTIFVLTSRRGLWALNPDGSSRWTRLEIQPRWPWWLGGLALGSGGVLYVPGLEGFYAYDVDGNRVWEHVVDSAGASQAFVGSPAIAPDGTVYTFTSTHLYAFWASAPPEPNSPWPMWRHDAQRTGWAR